MEVKYTNDINLHLDLNGSMFKFTLPNGGQIDDAIDVCGQFLEALKQLKASKEKDDSTTRD